MRPSGSPRERERYILYILRQTDRQTDRLTAEADVEEHDRVGGVLDSGIHRHGSFLSFLPSFFLSFFFSAGSLDEELINRSID
jgi:hypothetical protein